MSPCRKRKLGAVVADEGIDGYTPTANDALA